MKAPFRFALSPRSCTLPRFAGLALVAFALTTQAVALPLQDADSTKADTTQAKKKDKPLPLEAARTVSFRTDEGSWLSLDVSPDGQTLVFELLGDLYTLPIAGGTATRITQGMAFDSQPRYSPDGMKIVFVSDRSGSENLWVLDFADPDTLQLTQSKADLYQSPEWTPDGDYIVASKSSGLGVSKLWLYHVDGGSGTALVKEPETLKMMGAAFGDDARYVWYAQRSGNWQYNAQFPQYQLAVYDRETGERHTRTAVYGSAFRPTLSPDGRWLVYGTRHDAHTGLRLRDLNTGDERWLAYPVQRDDQESRATRDVLPGMAFTPDSQHLVASYGGKIWKIPIAGGDALPVPFIVDVDLGVGPEVAFDYPVDDAPTFVAQQIRDAVPSPDGQQLAFTALNRLYLMDYPDGTPRRLTDLDVNEHQPAWSPDGASVAFVTWGAEGGAVYKANTTGREQVQRLTPTPAYYRDLAWSPDGARLVVVRSPAQAFVEEVGGSGNDLVWIPATAGEPTFITPFDGLNNPHFTRDPDRIYAYSGSDGLVSIRWDGTDRKAHIKVKGGTLPGSTNPINASTVMMAPEGDQALAQVINDLYVVTVPYVGGETPTVSVANPASAAFPAKRLTTVGGQFPAWGRDGRTVHWSIGNVHFVYDLDAAQAHEDSVKAARKAESEGGGAGDDDNGAGDGEDKKDEGYQPEETRIAIEARRDLPEAVAVLRGARVITMQGDEVIEDGDVVVRNHRIEAVGPRGRVTVPGGAEVIDVSGKTIIPGFVDTHAHLRPPFGIHKTQVWEYLANLAYGVTTTRDPQTGTTDVLTYSDLVETGDLVGPRIYSTGPGVFQSEQVRDQEHASNILKRYSEYYDTQTLKMYLAGNRQQRQWIIHAAREQRIMPTTEGALDLKLNLTQLIDGYPGHEHNFPIYPLYKDVVELLKAVGTTYTPTLLVTYGGPWTENFFYTHEDVHDDAKLKRFTPHREVDQRVLQRPWFHELRQAYKGHARFVADLVKAGGRAGVGSHGQLQGLGYHWELWAVQSGGLSEHEALRVATILGAEGIGLSGDAGSLAPGKLADLIVLDANPLDDIRNTNTIRYVMKNGRLYDGDTLDEVYPSERSMQALWWLGREPDVVPGVVKD